MIRFKQGLDSIATVSSLDQLLIYTKGDMPRLGYSTDATIPSFADNVGTFIYPKDNWPNSSSYPIGSHDVYNKTQTQITIGGTDFNVSNLPTAPTRNADTVLYYQPTAAGVKFLITSKVWEQGSANYAFINDVNTLSITMYNGEYKDIYGNTSLTGGKTTFTMSVHPLDPTKMIDEADLINQLSELFFNKEWVIKYINEQLETVIPRAVDTAVKEAETVIQQRYVSR